MKTTRRKKRPPSNEILDVFYLLFCVVLVFLGVLYRLPSGYYIFRKINRSELFLTLVVCFSSGFSVRRRYFSDDFLVFSGGSRMKNSGHRASDFTEFRDPVVFLTPVVSRFLWIFRFERYLLDSSGFLSILLVFRTTYGRVKPLEAIAKIW